MSQTSHPTLINLPQPPSNPDTPEIPGTPTSTTTSLSALSTTAIKDGHKGTVHHHHTHPYLRGGPPQYDPSNSSLEAERADRISRLTGLAPAAYSRQQQQLRGQQPFSQSQSQQFQPPTGIAYFDAQGQPQMQNKMSTVGSASATEVSPSLGGGSVSGRSRTTTMRGRGGEDGDEDMLTEMDSASVAGGSGYVDEDMMMDDDDGLSRRSAGTYDEEDDGRESLVGFGEGAGSTVSGPIYHRRGLPSGGGGGGGIGGLERSNSGFSEGVTGRNTGTGSNPGSGIGRPFPDARVAENNSNGNNNGSNSDTPVSQTAAREIQQARMVDGVAFEGTVAAARGATMPGSVGDDVFVDTTTAGPVPMTHPTSAIRETQQPGSHQHVAQQQAMALAQQQQQQHRNHVTSPSTVSVGSGSTGTGANSREAAERIIREQFEGVGGDVGQQGGRGGPLGSPREGERLGRFYFEER
ncbi:hypothetical protein QBC41DRAFT_395897 [Cercophora samala]|uniref:Uncharacterized protein n=1 Tax=Cercophora samala TaxID=330535 RepID=A0AA40DBF5_9PEZI|nr:hypothetical protein QBC41DRAFT_395897 [Cercophora samala]